MIPVLVSGATAAGSAGAAPIAPQNPADSASADSFEQALRAATPSSDAAGVTAGGPQSGGNGGNNAQSGGNALPSDAYAPGSQGGPVQESEAQGDVGQAFDVQTLAGTDSLPLPGLASIAALPPSSNALFEPLAGSTRSAQAGAVSPGASAKAIGHNHSLATGALNATATPDLITGNLGSSAQAALTPSAIPPGAQSEVGAGSALSTLSVTGPTTLPASGESAALAPATAFANPGSGLSSNLRQSLPGIVSDPADRALEREGLSRLTLSAAQLESDAGRLASDVSTRAALTEDPQFAPHNRAVTLMAANSEALRQDASVLKAALELSTATAEGGRSLGVTTAHSSASTAVAVAGAVSLPLTDSALPASGRLPVSGVISAHPSEPAFSTDVAGRVALMVRGGSSEASLQLNPPELGRLDIRIATEGDSARVVFNVQAAETRDLLEQAMPRLREMLEESGLSLSRFDVADHAQQERDESPPLDFARNESESERDQNVELGPLRLPLADSQSLVDYYA